MINLDFKSIFFIYLCIISIVSIAFTVFDKSVAIYNGNLKTGKKGKSRISEAFLFFLASIGGSLLMLVTMKLIRHKTKHKRFMIGLPLIILLQILLVYYANNKFNLFI